MRSPLVIPPLSMLIEHSTPHLAASSFIVGMHPDIGVIQSYARVARIASSCTTAFSASNFQIGVARGFADMFKRTAGIDSQRQHLTCNQP
jgi:hypothetical protein